MAGSACGEAEHGRRAGLSALVEAYRIRTEEDRNHSSPPNANHLVSTVLVASEDSVSPARNDYFVL